jgi:hypothetical protein
VISSHLTACLSGGLPILMARNLKAKHMHWNSWLITTRGALLRDYDDRNACLIYGLDSSTTVLYQQNTNPDVLDIVVVKDFVLPVYLTVCPALSSDLLLVLIDTMCRTSFQRLLDRPRFQASGLGGIPGLPFRQTPGESREKRRGVNRQVR